MEKPLFINVYSGFYRIIVINSGNVGTIIHLKEGEIIKTSVGYQDKTSLEKLLIE